MSRVSISRASGDTVAMNEAFANRALAEESTLVVEGKGDFATTDDWTGMAEMKGVRNVSRNFRFQLAESMRREGRLPR